MKIKIAGISGFIGSNLLLYLKKLNYTTLPISKIDIVENKVKIDKNVDIVINLIGKAHDTLRYNAFQNYYKANTEISNYLFENFLKSNAKKFIFISSIKAVSDKFNGIITEDEIQTPSTNYGVTKKLAEKFICSKEIPEGKKVYILRPCMIHGPRNKGNLNLLFKFVSKGLPWPLGLFENTRSYLTIENLCFIIKELIEREDIPSGVYNVADDISLSTIEVIKMIAESKGKKARILNINKSIIKLLARLGDFLRLPLNSERLQKLTESYVVSNAKIKAALGKPLPISSREGLMRTFKSFADNA